ncbi:hypothetical protein ACROYT_G024622 [Oculina patagonica]
MKQAIVLIIVELFRLYGSSEGQATFQFQQTEMTVAENAGTLQVVVENVGFQVFEDITLNIYIYQGLGAPNQATFGSDYSLGNNVVVFGPSDPSTKVVPIADIIHDNEVEGSEVFALELQLQDPGSAALGPNTILTITIEDVLQDPDYTGDAQEAAVESITCGTDGQGIQFVLNIPDIAEWGNDDAAAWALVGTSDASCQPSFTANPDKVTYGPFDGNTCKTTITETSTDLEFLFEIDVVQPTGAVSFAYDHHYQVTCQYSKVEQNIQGSFLPLHSVSNTRQGKCSDLLYFFRKYPHLTG